MQTGVYETMRWKLAFLFTLLVLVQFHLLRAQSEYAATLEVLAGGVVVQRADTTNPIEVKVEAIVGVGDIIRTDATGHARITFFSDGVDTELLPNTEYHITRFEGAGESFNIAAEVLVGETVQRIGRLLDSNSSYDVTTPTMALAARGTEFRIRVNDGGRAAMLVTKGKVQADADADEAEVPPGYGIRREPDEALSDVVQATSFEGLDAALDGCTGVVNLTADVSLNARLGASLEFPRIATVDATEISVVMGKTETGDWYRIPLRGGFAWILSPAVTINEGCAGLRSFPPGYGPEDVTLYESLGNPVASADLQAVLTPAPTATQSP